MKQLATEAQVIVNVLGLKSSAHFERTLLKLISDHLTYSKPIGLESISVNSIYIKHAGMRLTNGYGQYKKFVYIEINGIDFSLERHSTDSNLYDFFVFKDEANDVTYSNTLKRLILDVIEERLEYIENKLDHAG